jgi:hypothetical protein
MAHLPNTAKGGRRTHEPMRARAEPYGVQVAPVHVAPASVQSWHGPPPVPHAELSSPTRQMPFWQHPAQSVGPHWLSVTQAPFKQDCPCTHCAHAFPPVPQDVGSVPVLQTLPMQQPWQFCGLQAIVQTENGVLEGPQA